MSNISLRDHFAGLAMQSILSSTTGSYSGVNISKLAYKMADAMIAERNKHMKERHEELCNGND